MPSQEHLETLNDPYFLFYRLFIGLRAVVKSIEACGDGVLALDRSLHSTLLPTALPVQQRRIAEAVFELLSFSVTRERRAQADRIATRIYGSKRTRRITEDSEVALSRTGDTVVLAVMIDGNTGETVVISKLPFRPSIPGSSSVETSNSMTEGNQNPTANSQELERSTMEITEDEIIEQDDDAARLTKMFLPECPKHSADCPYNKNNRGNTKTNSTGNNDMVATPFSIPADFTRMGYVENPELVMKLCPVCAAQTFLQSTWLSFSLFQQLHTVSMSHLALAPLPIPQELECLTPREGLAHTYHLAQRFFENALHSAMLHCHEVLLVDRLSYPVPLLLIAAKPQLKKKDSSKDVELGQESSDKSRKSGDGNKRTFLLFPHMVNSPFFNLSMDEESHKLKIYRSLAVLTHGCIHLSLNLAKSIPLLCPALEVYKLTSEQKKENDDNTAKTNSPVLDSIRSEYSLNEIFLVIRTTIQEACIFGFMDAVKGAGKAQRKLLQLCKVIVHWERDVFPHNKGAKHASRKEHSAALGLGPADEIYHYYSTLWNDMEVMNNWPWNQAGKSGNQPSRPIFKVCERDQVGEYFELKQIIFLLTIFFDLVEDKDNREEVEALEEYVKNPTVSATASPLFFIDGVALNYEVLAESARDLYSRRKAEHYSRLSVAANLLEEKVKPVLSELANSSNGGTTARARQLMAIFYLLKAEIIRFTGEGGVIDGDQDEVDQCVSEANTLAIKQTEAAREFLGVTMQAVSPPAPSPSTSQRFERKSDQGSGPKPPSSWRLLIAIHNNGSRDVLLHHIENSEAVEDSESFKRSFGELGALGLLPPLWIRMWLFLCRAVFRSSASDMIFAKENTGESPLMNTPKEAAEPTMNSSPDTLKEKKALRKKPKPSLVDAQKKRTKKELREQQEMERCARAVVPATLKLKYSLQEICFWHRWYELFIDSSKNTNVEVPMPRTDDTYFSPPDTDEKDDGADEIRMDSIPFLTKILHGVLCSFSLSCTSSTSPGANHFLPALQNDFPIFPSGEAAFSTLIKFGGSRTAVPHPCSFAKMDKQLSLFIKPSVSACTPALAKLVAGYWNKLGSPSFSSSTGTQKEGM